MFLGKHDDDDDGYKLVLVYLFKIEVHQQTIKTAANNGKWNLS